MRHLSRRLAVMTALALVLVSAASAQGRPQTREGFWIAFGFGYGSLGFDCPGCGSDREGGVSGYLKLGGTLSPKLLLGGETNGWTKDIQGTTVTATHPPSSTSIRVRLAGFSCAAASASRRWTSAASPRAAPAV